MHPSMEQIVMGAVDEGLLDDDAVTEGMLAVHEFVESAGLDPESPDTYTALVAAVSMIGAYTITHGDPLGALEAVARFSCRAYRDIVARG